MAVAIDGTYFPCQISVIKKGYYLHKTPKQDISLLFSSLGNSHRIYAGMKAYPLPPRPG